MKVLEIYPKDVHVVFEISMINLELLEKALSLCKIDYDGRNPDEVKAVNYLTKSFVPVIDEIMRKKGNES